MKTRNTIIALLIFGLISTTVLWLANIKFSLGENSYVVILSIIILIVAIFGIARLTRKKDSGNATHWKSMAAVVLAFLSLFVVVSLLMGYFSDESIFRHLGATLIICWIVTLLGYFTWAIYFYNVNYGWQEQDWTDHKEALDNGLSSKDDPKENPHSKDSLGLPPGTIRGAIALSIVVGGLAVTVTALSFPEQSDCEDCFIDHFDFFKEAFLMVIAFYFGTKGLEILRNENKDNKSVNRDSNSSSNNFQSNDDEASTQQATQGRTTSNEEEENTETTPNFQVEGSLG